MTNDEIWNEDGTPNLEAVQAQRIELRVILRDYYNWDQMQIDKIIPENLLKMEEIIVATEEEIQRAKEMDEAAAAANDQFREEMKAEGWTDEKIEKFLSSH